MNYYGSSHVGLRRKENQDCFCIVENDEHAVLGIVCDGIGGGNAGDVASTIAVKHMEECFFKTRFDGKSDLDMKHWLRDVIQEANDLIFTQAAKYQAQKGMGTTMVGVLIYLNASYVFNVGDSRTYGVFEDDFICLTEDHTYVADLLKRGEVSEEEAMVHPNRNVLINALGIWNQVRIDINKIKNDYHALLICSDGLHGYVHEEMLYKTLNDHQHNVKTKVQTLIQAALEAGGYDNVSVIMIEKRGEHSE